MKPDYGLDAPLRLRSFIIRGALLAALAIGLWISNGSSAAPLFAILLVAGAVYLAASAVMYWSSRAGKLKIRDRIIDSFTWRGDEKVLDVGCGSGLLLIGAAKRLKSGRATGVDIWRPEDLSGNAAESTRENAKAEGVADKIKLETADARKLPFQGDTFDAVVSGFSIHCISDPAGRAIAIREVARVLKPGGRLAIFDAFYANDYAKVLQDIGLADVRVSPLSFWWCVPTRTLTARKP